MPTRRAHPSAALPLLLLPFLAMAEEPDCSAQRLARPQVQALFAARDYAAAIERLQDTLQAQASCPDTVVDDAWYWLRSDLSLAYLKAGREQECLAVLAPLIDNPRSPLDVQHNLADDARVSRALASNQRLCAAAHEARLSQYQAAPCPDAPAGALDSVVSAPGHCLALMPAARGSCPSLQQWHDGKPQPALRLIDAEGTSPLADTSRCCSIQSLRLATEDGQQRLRLLGEGRDCFGGTAYDRIDALYSWQGDELRPLADYSRAD